jgi:hypothetical protein
MIKNCPHCGASLQYQAEQSTVVCEFCNAAIQLIDWESKKVLNKSATTERISVLRSQKEIFTKFLKERREKYESNFHRTKPARNPKNKIVFAITRIARIFYLIILFITINLLIFLGLGFAIVNNAVFGEWIREIQPLPGIFVFIATIGVTAVIDHYLVILKRKLFPKPKTEGIEQPVTSVEAEQELLSLESKIRAIDEEIAQLVK